MIINSTKEGDAIKNFLQGETMTKYALITGGSSGLGFGLAQQLVKEGYTPLLIARREGKLNEAVEALRKNGGNAKGYAGDITSAGDLTAIYESIKNSIGSIDFLVLNAGVVSVRLLSEYDNYEKMKEDIEIDLWGTVLATKIFLPLLRPKSKVLMISSGFGLLGAAGYSTYCAAKAGIVNFAEAMRRELRCKDITVHVACPADIDTPQYAAERKSMPEWMLKATPGRHNLLSPEKAACKILAQCRKNKFLIIINFEIKLLRWLSRILPHNIMLAIIDKSIPCPK
jgi:3-dehydrosphinganine reductase